MFDRTHNAKVRSAAFEWLTTQARLHDDVIPRPILMRGFELGGVRLPLLGPQGIFNPGIVQVPQSITTTPRAPRYAMRYDRFLEAATSP